MARKVFNAMNDTNDDKNLLAKYVTKKQELDTLTKIVKYLGEQVKQQMQEQQLKSTEWNGYKVTRIESERINWNEEALLTKVKTYNNASLIKTVEQVDLAALQQAIIDNEVNPKDLEECQTRTQTVSLRVNKAKEEPQDGLHPTR